MSYDQDMIILQLAPKFPQKLPKLRQITRGYDHFTACTQIYEKAPKIKANYHRVGSIMALDENWTLLQKE